MTVDLAAVRRTIDPKAPATGNVRCPVHDDRHPSLSVDVTEAGQLLCHCHAGCEQVAVFEEILRLAGHLLNGAEHSFAARAHKTPSLYTTTSASDETQRTTLSGEWLTFWRTCRPIRGTAAEEYLRRRCCVLPPTDGDLRFHPQARHFVERKTGPAMVALLTDAITGEARTLHLTFISADGSGKAAVDPVRLLLPKHRKAGAVCRLWPDESVTTGLCLAEGIETALSAAHAFTPVWAAIDAGNLGTFPVLGGIEALTIAADNDDVGLTAADTCAERWEDAGIEAWIVAPDQARADMNDLAAA